MSNTDAVGSRDQTKAFTRILLTMAAFFLAGKYRFEEHKPRVWRLFCEWSQSHLWQALLYLTALGIMTGLFWRAKIGKVDVALLCIAVALSNIAITRPMAGHDETAHMTNWYHALELEHIQTRPLEIDFNRSVHNLMVAEKFLQLHKVPPAAADLCPHMILQGCGDSDGPRDLYRNYIVAIRKIFGESLVPVDPVRIIYVIRIFQMLALFVLLVLASQLLGPVSNYAAYCGAILMCGSYWGQFSTLTNDIPMYMDGMLGLLALTALNFQGLCRRTLIAILIYSIMVAVTWGIDVSHIINAPIIMLIAIFMMLSALPWINKRKEALGSRCSFSNWLIVVATFAGFYSVVFANILVETPVVKPAFVWVVDSIPRVGFLLNPNKLSWVDFTQIFFVYMKSLAGSFVWGHTYYPKIFNILFIVAWIFGCRIILTMTLNVLSDKRSLRDVLCILFYFIMLGVYVGIIVKLGATQFDSSSIIEFESYAKPRLTAPGIALTLLPFVYFIKWASLFIKPQKYLIRFLVFTCLWQSFFAIKIYLNDGV